MGADHSFYVKAIETHARAFFKVIIFSVSSMYLDTDIIWGMFIRFKEKKSQLLGLFENIFLIFVCCIFKINHFVL